VIYVPSFFEHHFDHFSANQILIDAMQAARFECSDLLCYELWDNIPLPNYVVDISDQFERKLRMLSYYETPLKLTDYGQLCRNRNGLNHFLHVDPRRGQPGFAEVFHRFDSDTYQQIYSNYVKVLQEQGSSLTAHISVR
jgi:LmbE family N-acetylglucosaminyl deacetylase